MLYKYLAPLGHGRALEANYIGLKLLIGVSIFLPLNKITVAPLSVLQWYVPEPLIAMPFLMIGIVQLVGLIMNIRGYEASWILRLVGAGAGIGMWGWLLWRSWSLGIIASFVFPVSIMGILSSLFLAYMAKQRLPIPGTPAVK
jgi:hypothetical protein